MEKGLDPEVVATIFQATYIDPKIIERFPPEFRELIPDVDLSVFDNRKISNSELITKLNLQLDKRTKLMKYIYEHQRQITDKLDQQEFVGVISIQSFIALIYNDLSEVVESDIQYFIAFLVLSLDLVPKFTKEINTTFLIFLQRVSQTQNVYHFLSDIIVFISSCRSISPLILIQTLLLLETIIKNQWYTSNLSTLITFINSLTKQLKNIDVLNITTDILNNIIDQTANLASNYRDRKTLDAVLTFRCEILGISPENYYKFEEIIDLFVDDISSVTTLLTNYEKIPDLETNLENITNNSKNAVYLLSRASSKAKEALIKLFLRIEINSFATISISYLFIYKMIQNNEPEDKKLPFSFFFPQFLYYNDFSMFDQKSFYIVNLRRIGMQLYMLLYKTMSPSDILKYFIMFMSNSISNPKIFTEILFYSMKMINYNKLSSVEIEPLMACVFSGLEIDETSIYSKEMRKLELKMIKKICNMKNINSFILSSRSLSTGIINIIFDLKYGRSLASILAVLLRSLESENQTFLDQIFKKLKETEENKVLANILNTLHSALFSLSNLDLVLSFFHSDSFRFVIAMFNKDMDDDVLLNALLLVSLGMRLNIRALTSHEIKMISECINKEKLNLQVYTVLCMIISGSQTDFIGITNPDSFPFIKSILLSDFRSDFLFRITNLCQNNDIQKLQCINSDIFSILNDVCPDDCFKHLDLFVMIASKFTNAKLIRQYYKFFDIKENQNILTDKIQKSDKIQISSTDKIENTEQKENKLITNPNENQNNLENTTISKENENLEKNSKISENSNISIENGASDKNTKISEDQKISENTKISSENLDKISKNSDEQKISKEDKNQSSLVTETKTHIVKTDGLPKSEGSKKKVRRPSMLTQEGIYVDKTNLNLTKDEKITNLLQMTKIILNSDKTCFGKTVFLFSPESGGINLNMTQSSFRIDAYIQLCSQSFRLFKIVSGENQLFCNLQKDFFEIELENSEFRSPVQLMQNKWYKMSLSVNKLKEFILTIDDKPLATVFLSNFEEEYTFDLFLFESQQRNDTIGTAQESNITGPITVYINDKAVYYFTPDSTTEDFCLVNSLSFEPEVIKIKPNMICKVSLFKMNLLELNGIEFYLFLSHFCQNVKNFISILEIFQMILENESLDLQKRLYNLKFFKCLASSLDNLEEKPNTKLYDQIMKFDKILTFKALKNDFLKHILIGTQIWFKDKDCAILLLSKWSAIQDEDKLYFAKLLPVERIIYYISISDNFTKSTVTLLLSILREFVYINIDKKLLQILFRFLEHFKDDKEVSMQVLQVFFSLAKRDSTAQDFVRDFILGSRSLLSSTQSYVIYTVIMLFIQNEEPYHSRLLWFFLNETRFRSLQINETFATEFCNYFIGNTKIDTLEKLIKVKSFNSIAAPLFPFICVLGNYVSPELRKQMQVFVANILTQNDICIKISKTLKPLSISIICSFLLLFEDKLTVSFVNLIKQNTEILPEVLSFLSLMQSFVSFDVHVIENTLLSAMTMRVFNNGDSEQKNDFVKTVVRYLLETKHVEFRDVISQETDSILDETNDVQIVEFEKIMHKSKSTERISSKKIDRSNSSGGISSKKTIKNEINPQNFGLIGSFPGFKNDKASLHVKNESDTSSLIGSMSGNQSEITNLHMINSMNFQSNEKDIISEEQNSESVSNSVVFSEETVIKYDKTEDWENEELKEVGTLLDFIVKNNNSKKVTNKKSFGPKIVENEWMDVNIAILLLDFVQDKDLNQKSIEYFFVLLDFVLRSERNLQINHSDLLDTFCLNYPNAKTLNVLFYECCLSKEYFESESPQFYREYQLEKENLLKFFEDKNESLQTFYSENFESQFSNLEDVLVNFMLTPFEFVSIECPHLDSLLSFTEKYFVLQKYKRKHCFEELQEKFSYPNSNFVFILKEEEQYSRRHLYDHILRPYLFTKRLIYTKRPEIQIDDQEKYFVKKFDKSKFSFYCSHCYLIRDYKEEKVFVYIFGDQLIVRNDLFIFYKVKFSEISAITWEWYRHHPNSMSFYLKSRKAFLLKFPNEHNHRFVSVISQQILNENPIYFVYDSIPFEMLEKLKLTLRWKRRMISTYEYIHWLNIISGRSFLSRENYPIFPWIMANYDNDLEYVKFRNLAKNINTTNTKRVQKIKARELEDALDNECVILFKNNYISNKIGVKDLLFETNKNSLEDVYNDLVIRDPDDPRDSFESIEEYFYCPDLVFDKKVPKYFSNATEFVVKQRQMLEMDGANIEKWIDMVFGVSQQGESATQTDNTYDYKIFSNAFEDRSDDIEQVMGKMGNAPQKLFDSYHPMRNPQTKGVQRQMVKLDISGIFCMFLYKNMNFFVTNNNTIIGVEGTSVKQTLNYKINEIYTVKHLPSTSRCRIAIFGRFDDYFSIFDVEEKTTIRSSDIGHICSIHSDKTNIYCGIENGTIKEIDQNLEISKSISISDYPIKDIYCCLFNNIMISVDDMNNIYFMMTHNLRVYKVIQNERLSLEKFKKVVYLQTSNLFVFLFSRTMITFTASGQVVKETVDIRFDKYLDICYYKNNNFDELICVSTNDGKLSILDPINHEETLTITQLRVGVSQIMYNTDSEYFVCSNNEFSVLVPDRNIGGIFVPSSPNRFML
ncbi:Beige/BEACH domain containing protein [Trichomonas vaginalis G3]|uniref:Beige/BEACH domain containing protein n=1 Tax=Trichomonas vaginalis (strain ATCC PRA-98 / G3) TaxID=412133 RepID=A2DI78_TRIV3|nr:platelet formation protein family [Trichomonas vaginalis G3]EAY19874.1 Beige/BEACH domain containing protein [Trichomonas vaginalis G3]KAI5509998.1 platelet formation protein family [Trichomonas vaginalis G3]|eukprot:XP_001580860.1 Beige/BEACH domain containing protein [Trichomonas vaginalis G3]